MQNKAIGPFRPTKKAPQHHLDADPWGEWKKLREDHRKYQMDAAADWRNQFNEALQAGDKDKMLSPAEVERQLELKAREEVYHNMLVGAETFRGLGQHEKYVEMMERLNKVKRMDSTIDMLRGRS